MIELIQGWTEELLPKREADSFDLIVTSPPYNRKMPYNKIDDNRKDYWEWAGKIMVEMHRVIKTGSSLFLNVGSCGSDPWFSLMWASRMAKAGFLLQNRYIWVKSITVGDQSYGHFRPTRGDFHPHNAFEDLYHFVKGTERVRIHRLAIGVPFKDKTNIARFGHTEDNRCRGNVLFIPYDTIQRREAKSNPATFPSTLPEWCMKLAFGKGTGKMILDPFIGEGATAVAAKSLGHSVVGMDIDQEYLDKARSKIT